MTATARAKKVAKSSTIAKTATAAKAARAARTARVAKTARAAKTATVAESATVAKTATAALASPTPRAQMPHVTPDYYQRGRRYLLAKDPKLAEIIKRAGPCQMRAYQEGAPFSALVETIVSQQL